MKLLMLRAQITKDNEKYMCHNDVKDEDCWYVLLINKILQDGYVDEAQVWYYGLERPPTTYESGLQLKYDNFRSKYEPDIIFARGGFPEYVPVLNRYPKATKIYYGAGVRFLPTDGVKYDVILVDSIDRKKKVETKFPKSKVCLFHKGCADNLFPYKEVNKPYLVGNVTSIPTNKGQHTIGRALAGTGFKFQNIGQYNTQTVIRYRDWRILATWTGRLHRKEVGHWVRQCKYIFVGDHWRAGCPRVIPECMSLGIPIILLDDIPVSNIYTPNFFAVKTNKKELRDTIRRLSELTLWTPENSLKIHNYYGANFSLKICAKKFMGQLSS